MIELVPSKRKMVIDILEWMVALAILGWFVLYACGWAAWLVWFGLVVGIVSLAALGVALFRKQVPRISIDSEGILDRSNRYGRVSWKDIDGFAVEKISQKDRLLVKLKDEDAWIASLPESGRNHATVSRSLKLSVLFLNIRHLEFDAPTLAAKLRELKGVAQCSN